MLLSKRFTASVKGWDKSCLEWIQLRQVGGDSERSEAGLKLIRLDACPWG